MHHSSKIIVMGGKCSGKTALILRCLTGQFFPQTSTKTDTAYHFEHNGNLMDIIDTKGKNEALVSFADGIVLVYSITDRTSFLYLRTLMAKVRYLNFKRDLKIIVVGTKNDKAKDREVSLYEGQEYAVDNGCFFVETSACIPKHDIQDIFTQVLTKTQQEKTSLRIKRRSRASSSDYDSTSVTPPQSPTRKLSSSQKIYDSVRNFVQKKRRQSTSDYQRQYYQRPLNRALSKSLMMF
eukprot:TCONS_00030204-protein